MRNLYLIILLITSLILTSCQAEDSYDELANERNAGVFIYDSFLLGQWNVKSMILDREVDVNGDQEYNNDLMLETSCFNDTHYLFKADKTFTAVNSMIELRVNEAGDDYNCLSEKFVTGDWSLMDNVLHLYIKSDGRVVEENRHLIIAEDSFYFEVDEIQSKNYIKDAGNASVSGISIVFLQFSRKGK